jgi:hypothetical protein
MAADSSKDKVIISASEPDVVAISIDNSASAISICQCCLLCDNTRPFVNGYPPGPSPWVCDECKEAIAFVKKQLKHDPLKPILD